MSPVELAVVLRLLFLVEVVLFLHEALCLHLHHHLVLLYSLVLVLSTLNDRPLLLPSRLLVVNELFRVLYDYFVVVDLHVHHSILFHLICIALCIPESILIGLGQVALYFREIAKSALL